MNMTLLSANFLLSYHCLLNKYNFSSFKIKFTTFLLRKTNEESSQQLSSITNYTSSSSSDDEDIIEFINYFTTPRRIRIYRTRENHFQKWNEGEFYDRFCLTKRTAYVVLEQIRDEIKWPTTRNKALSPSQMLLLTLKFLATGNFLLCNGDFIGIHKSTAGKHIWRVLLAIVKLRSKYIAMPTNQNSAEIKKQFYLISKFPNVDGALDCTHIKLESPGGAQAETFRCRKQFFSLNVQAICTADLIIQDIVARWPGSAHDSRIFQNSLVKERCERGEFNTSILLGDSGYAVTNYCLTPLAQTTTPAEELFNEAQIRTRNPIERTFGVLKRRFPVLALGIRLALTKVQHICVACAILHNVAVKMNNGEPPVNLPEIEQAILETSCVPVDPFYRGSQNVSPHVVPYIHYFNNL